MAGEASIANSKAIIKEQYTQSKVYWVAYKNNPEIAEVRNDTGWEGGSKIISIQTEAPTGAGSTIAIAQAAANPGAYHRFAVDRIEDFGVARVKGQALRAAGSNKGALIDLWKREMEGAILQNTRSAAINFWGTGTGLRGKVGSISTNLLTLAEPTSATNFFVNMLVQASTTDGGTLIASGATEQIAKISRRTGILTSTSANWTTNLTGLAAGNFLYRNGDSPNNGTTMLMATGLQGWVPDTLTSALFWTKDRTVDDTRLAGQPMDGANVSMQEIVLDAMANLEVDGADEDQSEIVAWMHPRARMNLVKELQGKVVVTRTEKPIPGSMAKVGFKKTTFETPLGEATVRSSINVPIDRCFVMRWGCVSFDSLGALPHIIDDDGNKFLRESSDDAVEVRTCYYGNVCVEAPSDICNIRNFGR
jgi:hypothetical protein